MLLQYIRTYSLQGKRILELGAGSGLIAMHAARSGANVMASDINPIAVEQLKKNSMQNEIKLEIVLSDLFDNIRPQTFDMIIINPPYYKKKPASFLDHAWFCGEKGEYFSALFTQLSAYLHDSSQVIMILCDGCDTQMIEQIAERHHFRLTCVQTKKNILEKNFIYKIEQRN